jgi:drug/metabolite transporter (DMT)-like permease
MLALGTVYVVWGSSFLFTKIAVGSLPPALFSGIRFVTAGALLALIARFWRGDALPSRLVEWRHVYVNPAIAAFLGWQFLHEHLTGVQLAGMVIIILGVGLLTLPGGSLTDPKTLAEPKTQ